MSKTWLKQDAGKTGGDAGDTKVLRDENALLFAQLHVVQQELERRHYQGAGQQRGGVQRLVLDDSRFPEVVAEGLRYRKAFEARDDVYLQQLQRSLANRLGMAIIQGVSGPVAVFGLPGKLWSIWRDTRNYAPPSSLGGKGYGKVIAAYKEGGEAAVDILLQDKPASVKANAMTALARSLSDADAEGAARYAREAYELDPRPFRLKWLAFREHEAGRAEQSEALLAALPAGIKFSDSEQRQVGIVHADAERTRGREVLAKYDYIARRRELENKFRQLTQEQARQQASLDEHERQLDETKKAYADLERERTALASELAKHKVELLGVSQSRDSLQRAHTSLAREHADLVRLSEAEARESAERGALLIEQSERIESLEYASRQWEDERIELGEQLEGLRGDVQELARANEEKTAVVAQQQSVIDQSEQLRTQWEGDRIAYAERVEALQSRVHELTQAHDAKNALIEQQKRHIEDSDRLRLQWEQQCATLTERQSALQKNVDALSRVRNEQADLLVRQVDLFGSILGQQHEVANGFINQLTPSGAQLERQLRAVVKEETANANRQVQALIGLQGYYANGELPILNSERSTWPVSPDFALYLLQLIERKHYDLIVEFGSGTSTVLIAKALAQQAARDQSEGARLTRFVSFEHLPSYYEETLGSLRSTGGDKIAELRLTPLHTWTAADNTPYSYYDCGPVLESLAHGAQDKSLSILVMVDGPPAAVGKLARYPAAPLIKQFFPKASIDFVLDDFVREDEQRIAKLWRADLEASGFTCQVTERRLEKGACLISASQKN